MQKRQTSFSETSKFAHSPLQAFNCIGLRQQLSFVGDGFQDVACLKLQENVRATNHASEICIIKFRKTIIVLGVNLFEPKARPHLDSHAPKVLENDAGIHKPVVLICVRKYEEAFNRVVSSLLDKHAVMVATPVNGCSRRNVIKGDVRYILKVFEQNNVCGNAVLRVRDLLPASSKL